MHNCICDYIVLGNLMFYDAAIVQQLYVESNSVTRQHGGGAARLGRRFVHRVAKPNVIFEKWLLKYVSNKHIRLSNSTTSLSICKMILITIVQASVYPYHQAYH